MIDNYYLKKQNYWVDKLKVYLLQAYKFHWEILTTETDQLDCFTRVDSTLLILLNYKSKVNSWL